MYRFLAYLTMGVCVVIPVIGFVLYPDSSRKQLLDFPKQTHLSYSTQWNYRQSLNACGPYSAAAILRFITQEDVSSEGIQKETPWKYHRYGTLPIGLAYVLRKHGIDVKEELVTFNDTDKLTWLRQHISQNSPVILLVRKNGLLHYVTLVGYNEHEFHIYDSLEVKGKGDQTIDTNGVVPGNTSWNNNLLLTRWNQGGLFGLYKNYALFPMD